MKQEEIIKEIVNITKDLVEQLDLNAEISAQIVDGDNGRKYVNLSINGEDLGILIGYQGKMLRAFEQVLSMMVSKLLKSNKVEEDIRIVVDVNNYKDKRTEYIKELVLQAIDQVKQTGQKVELPMMVPSERRIVHMIIKDEKGIKSSSIGEEGERRVVLEQ